MPALGTIVATMMEGTQEPCILNGSRLVRLRGLKR